MSSTAAGTHSKVICDMDDHGVHGEMKNDAMSVAAAALEGNQEEKDISKHIKTHFDHKYGPTWFCIVGADFKAFQYVCIRHKWGDYGNNLKLIATKELFCSKDAKTKALLYS